MVSPILLGLGETATPQADRARILSKAFPFPPVMKAPACPIFLPGMGVWHCVRLAGTCIVHGLTDYLKK